MNHKFEKIIFFGCLLIFLLIISIGIISYKNGMMVVEISRRTFETQNILYNSEQILSEIENAETQERGFIITENEGFLETEYSSQKKALNYIKAVKALTLSNPLQQMRLNKLFVLCKSKIDFINRGIQIRKAVGLEEAQNLTNSETGLQLMMDIKSLLGEIKGEETARLFEDEELNKAMTQHFVYSINVLLILIAIIFLIVLFVILHNFKMRKRDEDEILQLNDELKSKVQELETTNTGLEAFTFSASHDLKTPIRAIAVYTGMLSQKYGAKFGNEEKEVLNTIIAAAKKTYQLLDDLIEYIAVGKKEIVVEKLNMNRIVNEVLQRLRFPEYSNAKIITDNLPFTFGDKKMITQVWENLISNALKYSSKKELPCVEIGCLSRETNTIFFVKDNGIGFNMRYRKKIFKVFKKLSGQEYEGTGKGLAITHSIIRKHKGRIWAEGKENEGAIFYFELPYQELKFSSIAHYNTLPDFLS